MSYLYQYQLREEKGSYIFKFSSTIQSNFEKIIPLIQEYKKYSTFVIASFSPDVLKIADRVYTLKDGKTTEKGKVKE